MKELRAVLRLRRDNDYNYEKIKDSFIPANGEICLVDTAKEGLRIICGNGVDKFGDLKFIDGTLIKGYYKNNNFYEDENFEKIVQGNSLKIYLNNIKVDSYYIDFVGGDKSTIFFIVDDSIDMKTMEDMTKWFKKY